MNLNDNNHISLDLSVHRIVNIRCVQNDLNSRKLFITLTNNGKLYDIDPAIKIRYKLCKADNKYIYNDITAITDDGEIFIDLTDQATSYVGVAQSELQLFDSENDQVISSMPFNVIVGKSVISNSSIESKDEFDALNHLMDRSEHIIEAGNKFADELPNWEAAELDRTASETVRKNSEDKRELNESIRIENENNRKESELDRCLNEDNREKITDETITEMENAIDRAAIISEKCEDLYNSQPFIRVEQKGAANGVAELDENGLLLSSQVPGAYDDVMEGIAVDISIDPETGSKTASEFILSGETDVCTPESGKIYIDISTSIQYRWSGTIFVTTGSNIALGETSQTAGRGDWNKAAYEHSLLKDGSNPHSTQYVDSSGDAANFNGQPPTYYATKSQLDNVNTALSDLFLYLAKDKWTISSTYGCHCQEIAIADMNENYIPIVSQSFESPIPSELETTEFAKLCGWETKNGSMIFYADTTPMIDFTLIVKGTAAKGEAVYGNLNSIITKIDETESQLADHKVLKATESQLGHVTLSCHENITEPGICALDAMQANDSIEGTLAKKILDIKSLLVPIGYIFTWEPVTGSTVDLSTPQKVHDHYGFGVWELQRDRFLLGAGGGYEISSTGGEAVHTLSAAEMPSHAHNYAGSTDGNNVDHVHGGATGTVSADHTHGGTTNQDGYHNHTFTYNWVFGLQKGEATASVMANSGVAHGTSAAGTHAHTFGTGGIIGNHVHGFTTGGQNIGHVHAYSGNTGATGSGVPHNNMPPYKAVYIWKRIA